MSSSVIRATAISGDASSTSFRSLDVDATLLTLHLNGIFNFHVDDEVVPYALLGVGVAKVEFENLFGFDVDDNSGSAQVGGGSRFFLGRQKKVAARVELSFLREDTFDFDEAVHVNLVGGFTWRLGAAECP